MNATLPSENLAGIGIHGGLDCFTFPDTGELVLVNLGLDPDVGEVRDLEHRLTLGHVLAFNDVLPNHEATEGREDGHTVFGFAFRQDLINLLGSDSPEGKLVAGQGDQVALVALE